MRILKPDRAQGRVRHGIQNRLEMPPSSAIKITDFVPHHLYLALNFVPNSLYDTIALDGVSEARCI